MHASEVSAADARREVAAGGGDVACSRVGGAACGDGGRGGGGGVGGAVSVGAGEGSRAGRVGGGAVVNGATTGSGVEEAVAREAEVGGLPANGVAHTCEITREGVAAWRHPHEQGICEDESTRDRISTALLERTSVSESLEMHDDLTANARAFRKR